MSIVVSCGCGQKLAAGPEMVGRLISCPKCGRMLTVGASTAAASSDSSAANSKLLLFVGIGAGAFLAIGVISLVAYFALVCAKLAVLPPLLLHQVLQQRQRHPCRLLVVLPPQPLHRRLPVRPIPPPFYLRNQPRPSSL